ncbi:peptidoglycan DD-metalloendopeptidase family protein [Heliobacterium gestii]|uniref:Peptidoglycan DD-metalloendopeptidase family protein n=1 Tax=Heliomicrobium gestii TaxID=2699 RepID=A0A845LHP3_HELGE|nr:M23 family metallopeptidase [Heliomicrobium gestii]MBM7866737.1 murein DD-endopeptidase MepM/ murein hydrolase activator NlpD [Heliomicrobium gestii]MZP42983.1 peptidoglycan DD-metalloendopeptidase family protein [Heliomicrobium gestii]
MRQRLIRGFVALLTTAVLLGIAMPGFRLVPIGVAAADDIDSKRQELDEVKGMIENTRRDLRAKEQERQGVLAKLTAVKEEMNRTEVTLNDLSRKTKDVEGRIGTAEKEIAEAQKRQASQAEALKARLKDMYINGSVSYLDVILQASSFMDFLSRMDLLEKIVDSDARLIAAIEAEEKAIADRKADLEARRSELAQLREQTEAQKVVLAQQSQETQKVLAQVVNEKDSIARMLDEEESASRQLESVIRAMQSKQNRPKMGNGPMTYPLPNNTSVSSPYGPRVHPVLKQARFHTGVDFPAPSGTPIHAAQTGVISMAGYYGAYGNTVIIDHGGGTATLYGHMSVINVSEGQTVQKGDVIGFVGSTGWSTGPHLHFEVRVNGNHTNPMPYLGG